MVESVTEDDREFSFDTRRLPDDPDATAPDGSEVRVLSLLPSASSAHFRLPPGEVSKAGRHRTVSEVWYVVSGAGEMWRCGGGREEVVGLEPGTCVTIPVGTSFQFRSAPDKEVCIFGVTIPPWPVEVDEWFEVPPHWELPG